MSYARPRLPSGLRSPCDSSDLTDPTFRGDDDAHGVRTRLFVRSSAVTHFTGERDEQGARKLS